MPNGSVLCAAGPAGEGGNFPGPTQFFEFDGLRSTPPESAEQGGPPYVGRILLILSGQVLFADGSNQIFASIPLPAHTGSKRAQLHPLWPAT